MFSFGRHSHRYRNAHHRGLPPLAIVAICVGTALIVTLIVGNLLKIFLDEETYNRLVTPDQTPQVTDPVVTNVPDINAYPFVWGASTQTVQGHVSVDLNTPDGTLNYQSPVSSYLAIPQTDTVDFTSSITELNSATSYISGVFYPQALAEENLDLQYAVTVQERAILREFLNNGGNDILLAGLALDLTSAKQVAAYAEQLKNDTDAPIGVAVPLSVVQSNNGWEILAILLKSCDFCALDLRETTRTADQDIAEYLKSITYYLLQCDMRLLLAENQTELIAALPDSSVTDFQIMTATHPQDPPDDDEPTADNGSVG